ncbi:MAG: hypothetical protein ABI700_04370 [Chloroflexota bacterium]
MLRFLTAVSALLLIVLTGIGLMLSRQWGWSEYTSPELYLLYAQDTDKTPDPFFVIDIQSSAQSPLAPQDGALQAASCSPDGRTLAYLNVSGHLYVVNQAGEIYDRKLGPGYDAVDLANNGVAAVARTDAGIVLVVTPDDSYPPLPPDHIAYDPIKIISSGATLWSHTAQGGIKLLAPSGETTLILPPSATSPNWLASEQLFTFEDFDGGTGSAGGMVDTARQQVVHIRHSNLPLGILSPDSRIQVVRFVAANTNHEQLYLVDPLSSQPKKQLTNDDVFHQPICFLTFRPTVLIR